MRGSAVIPDVSPPFRRSKPLLPASLAPHEPAAAEPRCRQPQKARASPTPSRRKFQTWVTWSRRRSEVRPSPMLRSIRGGGGEGAKAHPFLAQCVRKPSFRSRSLGACQATCAGHLADCSGLRFKNPESFLFVNETVGPEKLQKLRKIPVESRLCRWD